MINKIKKIFLVNLFDIGKIYFFGGVKLRDLSGTFGNDTLLQITNFFMILFHFMKYKINLKNIIMSNFS